jgi:diguanylate cyclase (GGDEF)-like protein
MNSLSESDRAQVIEDATSHFWLHLMPIVWMALFFHFAMFFVFLFLQVKIMAAINVLSVIAYVLCLFSVRLKRYMWAGVVMNLEVIIHAAVATFSLGWDSNFYFYLFCIVPVMAFCFKASSLSRFLLSFAIVVVAVGGYAARESFDLRPVISADVTRTFGLLNAFVSCALLLYGSVLFVRFVLSMQLNHFNLANRDPLTNLYTRRRLMSGFGSSSRYSSHVKASMILLDIDNFKAINDGFGHEHGDSILKKVSQLLVESVRLTDIAARWGGEEFLILMPDTKVCEAEKVAIRILNRIRAEAGTTVRKGLEVTATLAVGYIAEHESFSQAFDRIDKMLYAGKISGRNCVVYE